MHETLTAVEMHLAREAYGAALAAWVEGTGTDAAVAAALGRLEAAELAAERAAFRFAPSGYLRNGGR